MLKLSQCQDQTKAGQQFYLTPSRRDHCHHPKVRLSISSSHLGYLQEELLAFQMYVTSIQGIAHGSRLDSDIVSSFIDKPLASIQRDKTSGSKGHEYLDNDDRSGRHTYSRSLHLSPPILGGDRARRHALSPG